MNSNPGCKVFKSFVFKGFAVSCLIFFTSVGISASAAVGIVPNDSTASPWIFYNLKPGQKVQDSITLNNSDKGDTLFKLEATDSSIDGDGTFGLVSNSQNSENFNKWFTFPGNNFLIESSKNLKIPYLLQMPTQINSGEYSGAITVLEFENANENENTNFTISKRTGQRVYVAIGDDFNLNARLDSVTLVEPKNLGFESLKKNLDQKNLAFEITAQNNGNIFGQIDGQYSLKLPTGESLAGKFSKQISANSKVTKYLITTNLPYIQGETTLDIEYTVKPLNPKIDLQKVNNQNPSSNISTNYNLSSGDIQKIPNNLLKIEKNYFQDLLDKFVQNWIKITIVSEILVIIGLLALIFYKFRSKIKVVLDSLTKQKK